MKKKVAGSYFIFFHYIINKKTYGTAVIYIRVKHKIWQTLLNNLNASMNVVEWQSKEEKKEKVKFSILITFPRTQKDYELIRLSYMRKWHSYIILCRCHHLLMCVCFQSPCFFVNEKKVLIIFLGEWVSQIGLKGKFYVICFHLW